MSESDESIFNESRFLTEEEALEIEQAEVTPEELVQAPTYRLGTRIADWCLERRATFFIFLIIGFITVGFLLRNLESHQGLFYLTLVFALVLAFLLGAFAVSFLFAGSLKMAAARVCTLAGQHSEKHGFIIPDSASTPLLGSGITRIDQLCSVVETVLAMPLSRSHEIAAEYQELRERYELVTTNIAASVIIRKLDGSVVLCSPYTQVLTGYSSEEIEELHAQGTDFLREIVNKEDLQRYERACAVSQLGEDIFIRYRIRHKSGLSLWLETRMVPVVDEDGEVASVMNVTIDVTDTLTYQQQIEEQNQDLSDFAYMVSHDLKAPIFTIKGMANALLEDYGSTLEQDGTELINFIVDGTNRLEQLVASVIEYSSVATKEGDMANVDLGKVLADVIADLRESIKQKNAEIRLPQGTLPSVIGDTIRVYQVFSNLIGNALKYSSPERAPRIAISVSRPSSDTVAIEIVDNGLGIPEGRLDDIFRPYHRAHGADIEGSGIGLACVKKILDRLGGTVSVSSRINEGSIFTVTFPSPPSDPRAIPEDLARLF